MNIFRGIAGCIAVVISGTAACHSVRLAYADYLFRENTVASLARAVEAAPGNSLYHAWYAQLLDFEGRDPVDQLLAAVRLNPRSSAPWLLLAQRAEGAGDRKAAEEYLLASASHDKLFAPRWALVNFYFRGQNEAAFRTWTTRALEMSYGDRSPLFRLCWLMTPDADKILAMFPRDHLILRQYLYFLLSEGRTQAAGRLVADLLPKFKSGEADAVMDIAEHFLQKRFTSTALRIWNHLAERGLIAHGRLDPGAGASLSNGSFSILPLQRVFDWRHPAVRGVSVVRRPQSGMRFTFTGRQPERAEILVQVLPVAPSRLYRLRFEYQANGSGDPGVRWRVAGAGKATQSRSFPESPEWREEEFEFSAGSEDWVRLALFCERTTGSVRFEGVWSLRNLKLDFAR